MNEMTAITNVELAVVDQIIIIIKKIRIFPLKTIYERNILK